MKESAASSDLEAVLQHCVAITSSLELEQVAVATLRALHDLLPVQRAVISLGIGNEARVLAADPTLEGSLSDALEGAAILEAPLLTGPETIGTLQCVTRAPDAFTDAHRVLLVALAPAVSAAIRNALALARQRESWEHRRTLTAQKSTFMMRAADDLGAPIEEILQLGSRMRAADPEDVPTIAAELFQKAQRLGKQVEEILALSLSERV